MDWQMNRPKPICPFNFFKVGGITMHKFTSYGPDKLNLWPFYHLTFKCDLDLQPTWTNVSNGTSPPRGQQLCKIILKSMHKCTSYGLDKLNLWPFWILFDPSDLDLKPTWKNYSNGTSPPWGQQLQKLFWNPCINVQVMARTSSIYDHFDLYLTPVTLTFNLPKKMFQMALLEDNKCAKLFWNPFINVQVMAQTSSIYDHFDIFLTPVTLTINLPEKMFQMALLLREGNNCAKLFWNPCINVQVMAQTSSICDIL